MCGRYTNTKRPEEINDRLGIPIHAAEAAGTGRYNIAPTEPVLTIVLRDGKPRAQLLRWGLVPHWATDLRGASKMINARVETVATRPAYRALLPTAQRRALMIADGYFEWLKPEHRSEPRQPFHFQVDGGELFAFAALWTPARIAGERVESVVMLTCGVAGNPVAAAIHDRMPVILADREAQQAWLDPALGAGDVLELCEPLAPSRLSAHPANPAVNKAGAAVEGPELLQAPA
ncbi:MAG TPA: SOS response-associated peptidase [Solirubrobacteraceae bacterium]